ncbi:MAG: hypothetical protein HYZ29_23880 [Myxococcales bacterium]|nr:hypothetical protein [Myxococcales bacterium]
MRHRLRPVALTHGIAIIVLACSTKDRGQERARPETALPSATAILADPGPHEASDKAIEIGISGDCREEHIRSPVTIISPILDQCFRRRQGSVSVTLRISDSGVPTATNTVSHHGSEAIVRCIQDALEFLRFSKTPRCTATVRVART